MPGEPATAVQYAQQHNILVLLQRMTERLLLERPLDPIQYLVETLTVKGDTLTNATNEHQQAAASDNDGTRDEED